MSEEKRVVKAFFGTLFAIVLQTAACYVLYRYDIPNPNIILFVFLSAMLVQFGYPAGIAAGAIAFVYSVFFFSVDHGMTSFTAGNGEKLLVASIGIVANIAIVGQAHRHSTASARKIARLEVEKQKAEQVACLAKKAQAAYRAKTMFFANMSHDIRTPLNGIIGLIRIDQTHMDDTEMLRENHRKMLISADYLLSLINDVLQMSKLEAGSVELEHEIVDLNRLNQENQIILEEQIRNANVTFREDAGCHRLPCACVYGSPGHLRQIFLNIYGNCIKYNKPGGSVTTRLQCVEQSRKRVVYRWTISDTGIGMSPEFLKRIYEPFSQESLSARTNYQGTGLGMAIVKGLLDKMGGTIQVSSRQGVGSTFEITIPFEIAPKEALRERSRQTVKGDIHDKKLLLAEDNTLNAEIARTLLTDEGAQVTVVSDGQQALDLFRDSAPGTFDAILMDVMMPVLDGIAATRAIRALSRADAKTVPILSMTANAFPEDAKRCMDAGMNCYLTKPLELDKVVAAIAQCCEKVKTK